MIKKGFSTIYCQLLSKFTLGKGKSKGIGTLNIWELHHGMGQNRTTSFQNRIAKQLKGAQNGGWKNHTEGQRDIRGIIVTLGHNG